MAVISCTSFAHSSTNGAACISAASIDRPRLRAPRVSARNPRRYAPLDVGRGVLLNVADGHIQVRPFDPRRQVVTADPTTIPLPAGGNTPHDAAMLSVSPRVLTHLSSTMPYGQRLVSSLRTGGDLTEHTNRGIVNWPRLSPDGTRLGRGDSARLAPRRRRVVLRRSRRFATERRRRADWERPTSHRERHTRERPPDRRRSHGDAVRPVAGWPARLLPGSPSRGGISRNRRDGRVARATQVGRIGNGHEASRSVHFGAGSNAHLRSFTPQSVWRRRAGSHTNPPRARCACSFQRSPAGSERVGM